MIQRNITKSLLSALHDTPVVFLAGARQTGKSTLVKYLADGPFPASYLTFDDWATLNAAQHDPSGFCAGLQIPVVLDEVQRAPAIFQVIKTMVDKNRKPGQFLLTGSANILALPHVSESLAGRMEVCILWPFTQGEIAGLQENFVDATFSATPFASYQTQISRQEIIQKIIRGGYPEPRQREQPDRRNAWFQSYITTLLQRDVRDLANIDKLDQLPNLLNIIATRTANLISAAEISRSAGLPQTTLKRYLALLDALFLTFLLPAWSGSLTKRLVKAPKINIVDTGLASYLIGGDEKRLATNNRIFGSLLETYVVNELLRQTSWSQIKPKLFHFRTHGNREVDIILEDRSGRCVAIEIKATATPNMHDFNGLNAFAELAGTRMIRGIVLYLGDQVIPLAKNMCALPLSVLWTGNKNS